MLSSDCVPAPAIAFVQASATRNLPKFSIDIPHLVRRVCISGCDSQKYLAPAQLEALEKEPISLHSWDPMGALAD
ncbi:MAG: hypothetical protein ACLU62_09155 [Hydrogeniiclostridium sp.]